MTTTTLTNVERLAQLTIATGERQATMQGVIVAMISNPATRDEVLRAAELVAHALAADAKQRNACLSVLRVQLGRAQDKAKLPRQSFKLVGNVALWKSATDKPAVDYLAKIGEAIAAAVAAGQLTEAKAAAMLEAMNAAEQVVLEIVQTQTDRPRRKRAA